jgi:hypothetical protein
MRHVNRFHEGEDFDSLVVLCVPWGEEDFFHRASVDVHFRPLRDPFSRSPL